MTPGDCVWVDVEVGELGLLVLGQLVGVGLVDAQLLQTPDLIRRRENSFISAGARASWIRTFEPWDNESTVVPQS